MISIGDIIELGSTIIITVEESDEIIHDTNNPTELSSEQTITSKSSTTTGTSLSIMDNKQLRRKFFMTRKEKEVHTETLSRYNDRATKRRNQIPQKKDQEDEQLVKPPPTVDEVYTENKGFKLLKQMGWKEGLALGRTGSGIVNPIQLDAQMHKRGLGFGR
jgi:hypothetical protein